MNRIKEKKDITNLNTVKKAENPFNKKLSIIFGILILSALYTWSVSVKSLLIENIDIVETVGDVALTIFSFSLIIIVLFLSEKPPVPLLTGLTLIYFGNLENMLDQFFRFNHIYIGFAAKSIIFPGILITIPSLFYWTKNKLKEEKTLKESEKHYKDIFSETSDSIFITDLEGNFLKVNRATYEALGYSHKDLMNKKLVDVISPGQIEYFGDKMNEIFQNGRAFFDAELKKHNGRPLYVEINSRMIKFKGEPAILSMARDITKRKWIEDALKKNQKKYRELINLLPQTVFEMDLNGNITYMNNNGFKTFGYTKYDLETGLNILQLIDPDEHEMFKEDTEKAMNGETLEAREYKAVRKDNTTFPMLIYSTPIIQDSSTGLRGIIVDITERKRMEKSIIELNEVLRLINKILRHDTLNDLAVVSGSIEVYQDEKDEKLLKNALQSVNKSVELIRKMRQLEALVSTGKKLEKYNLREITEENIQQFPIEYEIHGDCEVLADEALNSVISNIIRNAIKHGEADKIKIKISNDEKYCFLRIEDNGKGIPNEYFDKIFDEGFSGGNSTGLGLYIAKKTIERYGGDITCENMKDKSHGATFIIKLRVPEGYVEQNRHTS